MTVWSITSFAMSTARVKSANSPESLDRDWRKRPRLFKMSRSKTVLFGHQIKRLFTGVNGVVQVVDGTRPFEPPEKTDAKGVVIVMSERRICFAVDRLIRHGNSIV